MGRPAHAPHTTVGMHHPKTLIRDGVRETWLAPHTLPPGLCEAYALVLSAEDSPSILANFLLYTNQRLIIRGDVGCTTKSYTHSKRVLALIHPFQFIRPTATSA